MAWRTWPLGYKLALLACGVELVQVKKARREFGVARAGFCRWKKRYNVMGVEGLSHRKPIGTGWPNQPAKEVVETALHIVSESSSPSTSETTARLAPLGSVEYPTMVGIGIG